MAARYVILENYSQHAGQWLSVEPPCSDILACLRTVEHRLANDEEGCHISGTLRQLIEDGEYTVGYCHPAETRRDTAAPVGLLPVVVKLLQDAGHDVGLLRREISQLQLDDGAVDRGEIQDRHVIEFVGQNDRGLVRYNQTVKPANLIGQIATAFPAATIAIATARRDDARNLTRELGRLGLDVALSLPERQFAPEARVIVGTYIGMTCFRVRLHRRDIFIAADAVQAIGNEAKRILGRAWRARIIGLLPAGKQLAPLERDMLRCLFGFAECNVAAHGQGPGEVRAIFQPFACGPPTLRDRTVLEMKRRAVWRHPLRNRIIAKLAKLLRAGDEDALTASFPAIAAAVEPGPKRVAILVENVEHLGALSALLPQWLPVTSNTRMAGEPGDAVIATFEGSKQINLAEFDIVLRADAGAGALPEDCRCDPTISRLIVDLTDRHHPQLRRRTRRRRRAYRELGWYAPGANPVAERVADFIRNRPRS